MPIVPFVAPRPRFICYGKYQKQTIYIPGLGVERDLRIYTPPFYDFNNQRHPTLYMQDGQNLFGRDYQSDQPWGMETVVTRLSEMGLPVIVVGIDHGGIDRLTEYGPWPFAVSAGESLGKGACYADFLAGCLKPYIDSRFRTLPDPCNSLLIGSSMGALISFYTALQYPYAFGGVGALSPSFALHIVGGHLEQFVRERFADPPVRVYMDIGDCEGADHLIGRVSDARQWLLERGFPQGELKTAVIAGGRHTEQDWGARLAKIVAWLLKQPAGD